MTLLADTGALIIDLRSNGGGDPEGVALLVSYRFAADDARHINDIYWRPDNSTRQFWTSVDLSGRRYPDKPVYVRGWRGRRTRRSRSCGPPRSRERPAEPRLAERDGEVAPAPGSCRLARDARRLRESRRRRPRDERLRAPRSALLQIAAGRSGSRRSTSRQVSKLLEAWSYRSPRSNVRGADASPPQRSARPLRRIGLARRSRFP
jgi:hypothetical protein